MGVVLLESVKFHAVHSCAVHVVHVHILCAEYRVGKLLADLADILGNNGEHLLIVVVNEVGDALVTVSVRVRLVVGVILPCHSSGFYLLVNAVVDAYHRQVIVRAYFRHVFLARISAVEYGEQQNYRDVLLLGEQGAHKALVCVLVVSLLAVVYREFHENDVRVSGKHVALEAKVAQQRGSSADACVNACNSDIREIALKQVCAGLGIELRGSRVVALGYGAAYVSDGDVLAVLGFLEHIGHSCHIANGKQRAVYHLLVVGAGVVCFRRGSRRAFTCFGAFLLNGL